MNLGTTFKKRTLIKNYQSPFKYEKEDNDYHVFTKKTKNGRIVFLGQAKKFKFIESIQLTNSMLRYYEKREDIFADPNWVIESEVPSRQYMYRENGPCHISDNGFSFGSWGDISHHILTKTKSNYNPISGMIGNNKVNYIYRDVIWLKAMKIHSTNLTQLSTVPDLDGFVLADVLEEAGYDKPGLLHYLRVDPTKQFEFLEVDKRDYIHNAVTKLNNNLKTTLIEIKKQIIKDIQGFHDVRNEE